MGGTTVGCLFEAVGKEEEIKASMCNCLHCTSDLRRFARTSKLFVSSSTGGGKNGGRRIEGGEKMRGPGLNRMRILTVLYVAL